MLVVSNVEQLLNSFPRTDSSDDTTAVVAFVQGGLELYLTLQS
jgi:hypothetical protein